ncbi:F-box/SPRY domain-containing protein 1 isoform X1 [Tursiops truncatus]|uniref:F-box/SPRY domain-containing protein 1 isoform X1 n=1 Tax=Tursiops truncatus TaxID=9739 RepID=UPI003CCF53BE
MAAPAPGAGAASGGAGCSGGGGAGAGSGAAGAGGRLPSRVLELVFSYLELSELRSCALVCKHWYRCLHGDENSEVWRSLCARSLAEEALRTDILCNLPSYKAKIRAFQHAFSTNDCSRNVYIKKNGFTLHRNPIAQSTDGARTKIGFSEGRHAWEVWWEGPLGTVAVIGIATKRAPMQCQGYVALLGSDDQSWGWNLVDNNLLHNGEVNGSFPQCNNAPKYQHRLRTRSPSGHGSRAQPLRGMRDPPGLGHEPASPASAGGPSTTAPPGKPLAFISDFCCCSCFVCNSSDDGDLEVLKMGLICELGRGREKVDVGSYL